MASKSIGAAVRGSARFLTPDRGRLKAYKWEWANAKLMKGGAENKLSREAAKGLARLMVKVALRRLAAKHNLTPEMVAKVRGTYKSRFTKERRNKCWAGLNGTYFADWGWNPSTIAHEVAHWAHMMELEITRSARKETAHGPEWLGWFALLASDVNRVPLADLSATVSAAGLRFVLP
jgi:hypothetical protein